MASDTAVVLKYIDYRDSDRIVSLLTEKNGLVSVIARRARSSKSLFSGVIDIGNIVKVELKEPKQGSSSTLWNLNHAKIVEGFLHSRRNIIAFGLLSYCCETTLSLIASEQREQKHYGLLCNSLSVLNDAIVDNRSAEELLPGFIIGFSLKLLAFSGLRPQLSQCAHCHSNQFDQQGWRVVPLHLTFVHRKCQQDFVENLLMSGPASTSILGPPCSDQWRCDVQTALLSPLAETCRQEERMKRLSNGPFWAISEMIEHAIERQLDSTQFLKELNQTTMGLQQLIQRPTQ